MKVQAVIADVDGVMVGKDPGINFPLPNESIISALRFVSKAGVPIILCTAKFRYAVKGIALQAELANPHITDAGALISTFHDNTTKIIKKHKLDPAIVSRFAKACLDENIYFELCSPEAYFIDTSQVSELTERRIKLLQQQPQIMHILEDFNGQAIIKTVAFIDSPEKKQAFETLMKNIGPSLSYIWSHHPYLEPYQPAVITLSGVSKASATKEIAEQLGLDLTQCLGIGDSESDWDFMSLCGKVGVVGDNSKELVRLASTKDKDQYYIAPDVRAHGLLEIFSYFNLI